MCAVGYHALCYNTDTCHPAACTHARFASGRPDITNIYVHARMHAKTPQPSTDLNRLYGPSAAVCMCVCCTACMHATPTRNTKAERLACLRRLNTTRMFHASCACMHASLQFPNFGMVCYSMSCRHMHTMHGGYAPLVCMAHPLPSSLHMQAHERVS